MIIPNKDSKTQLKAQKSLKKKLHIKICIEIKDKKRVLCVCICVFVGVYLYSRQSTIHVSRGRTK